MLTLQFRVLVVREHALLRNYCCNVLTSVMRLSGHYIGISGQSANPRMALLCCAQAEVRGLAAQAACPTRRARTARASASWARCALACLSLYVLY